LAAPGVKLPAYVTIGSFPAVLPLIGRFLMLTRCLFSQIKVHVGIELQRNSSLGDAFGTVAGH